MYTPQIQIYLQTLSEARIRNTKSILSSTLQAQNLMHASFFVINLHGALVLNRQRFIFETRLRAVRSSGGTIGTCGTPDGLHPTEFCKSSLRTWGIGSIYNVKLYCLVRSSSDPKLLGRSSMKTCSLIECLIQSLMIGLWQVRTDRSCSLLPRCGRSCRLKEQPVAQCTTL